MKSKRLTLSVLFVVAAVANALACTNLIVGKNASADGSTIVSYSADSYGLFGELYHYPAGMHKKGTLIDIHEWDTGKYLGQIEQARQTYNVIGNMNEFQLTIGETTFGGRPELVDTTGIIDYAKNSTDREFIIGTENSILQHLQYECPEKSFYPLSKDCVCHNMKLTTLMDVYNCVKGAGGEEIILPDDIRTKAKACIDTMLTLGE